MKLWIALLAMFACFCGGITTCSVLQKQEEALRKKETPRLIGNVEYVPSGAYKVTDESHPLYLLEGHSYRGSGSEEQFCVVSQESLGKVGSVYMVAPAMRR